jgi:D-ribose pyranose/furanose isomerase RbsD
MIRKVDVGSVFGRAQRTSYEYMKLLIENRIIEEIVLKEYLKNKKQSRYNILKKYLSNNSNKLKFKNRTSN